MFHLAGQEMPCNCTSWEIIEKNDAIMLPSLPTIKIYNQIAKIVKFLVNIFKRLDMFEGSKIVLDDNYSAHFFQHLYYSKRCIKYIHSTYQYRNVLHT